MREKLSRVKQSKRFTLAVFVTLRAAIIFCMARQLLRENYQNVMLCIVSLVVMSLPALLHQTVRLRLPGGLEITVALFVFAAEILGEISNFYGQFPFWDTMLHTVNGFLAAAIGFGIIDLLNYKIKGLRLSPLFVALVSFCFSMTVGVVWEFVEFGGDQIFRKDMQKDRIVQEIASIEINPTGENEPIEIDGIAYTILYDAEGGELWRIEGGYLDIGIIDTMKDLLVNMAGALFFAVLGYRSTRRRMLRQPDQFTELFRIDVEGGSAPPPKEKPKTRLF